MWPCVGFSLFTSCLLWRQSVRPFTASRRTDASLCCFFRASRQTSRSSCVTDVCCDSSKQSASTAPHPALTSLPVRKQVGNREERKRAAGKTNIMQTLTTFEEMADICPPGLGTHRRYHTGTLWFHTQRWIKHGFVYCISTVSAFFLMIISKPDQNTISQRGRV